MNKKSLSKKNYIKKMNNKGNEAPNPRSQINDDMDTPKPIEANSKLLKEKKIALRGLDEQDYNINIKLYEGLISIEAYDNKDVTQTKYLINLAYEEFTNINSFFNQFSKEEEIFELLEDMKKEEFKILKNNPNFIEFYLLIEQRKKIIEIPFKLMVLKNDVKDIVQKLCETMQNLKDKEIADLKNRNENLEKKMIELNENLVKQTLLFNESLKKQVREFNEVLEKQKSEFNQKLDIFESRIQEEKKYQEYINKRSMNLRK